MSPIERNETYTKWEQDAITMLLLHLCALLICLYLGEMGYAEDTAPVIFVLAVFLTGFFTNGYLWSLLGSLLSVFVVNYFFTEPFSKLSFSGPGYPITFVTLFVVGILTSTMTVRSRDQQRLRAENEKERTRGNLLRAVSHDLRTPLTAISGAINTVLEGDGYTVEVATCAAQARAALEKMEFSAMLLDLGLPDADGLELLRELRQRYGLPVIVVSARTEESEKVAALDSGADDYITKPFGSPELLARIRAALRRAGPAANLSAFTTGELTIDYDKHLVTLAGQPVHLTANEYRLVELLSRSAGKVLTYDRISEAMWGDAAGGNSQLLRVNMANIRRKLEQNPAEPQYILTEIGVGYRMKEPG